MIQLRVTYDGMQHCIASHETKAKRVATDACSAAGGKGQELSPGELVASGLAGCMLLSMGFVAQRDRIDVRGTTADVEVSFRKDGGPIQAIDLVFTVPGEHSARDREKLQAGAETCPIKHSFHPRVAISARFEFDDPAELRAREHAGGACC